MPFFIGYFGKSLPAYFNQMKQVAHENAMKMRLITVSDNSLHIFSGIYNHEIQSDYIVPAGINQGLLVGKIFDSTTYERVATFKSDEIDRIIQNPQWLTKHYWGRYSGILYDQHNQKITLVRDPLGLSTLFYKKTDDGILFASDLSLLHDVLEEKPSLNFDYFAEYIINHNYVLPITAFQSIQELLPGVAATATLNGLMHQEHLWNLPQSSFIKDLPAFEEELLITLKACVKAWASDNNSVCVELSGGIDSSGLMILLKDCLPPHIPLFAVNRIDSKESSSNEIEYAKEVAQICNAPLYFCDTQEASLFDPLPSPWRPDHPSTFVLLNKMNNQLKNLAQNYGSSHIMNGHGGDHVFLANPSSHILSDYWIEKGWKGINAPLKELSAINRSSWLSIINKASQETFYYYAGKTDKQIDLNHLEYLHPSFKSKFKLQSFYLKEKISDFGPAKQAQIKGLFHAILYADRTRKIPGMTITHPFLSQPIVELGLKIPVYQSFKNGYNRIIFRNAVSRIKAPQALWRPLKGHTTTSTINELSKQADAIRNLLSNGVLVQSEVLNKQWIEQELTKIKHGHIDTIWPLIHMITAQIWCNQWQK